MTDCLICCEEKDVMTVGECEHPYVCLVCAYKLRSLNKNVKCIYCNQELHKIIAVNNPDQTYEIMNKKNPVHFSNGIHWVEEKVKWACYDLQSIKCSIKECKKRMNFNNIAAYKKHLKDDHRRYLCDLCVQNRTLMAEEHKIYRKEELDSHYYQGDYDEEDNLIFMHPYCSFCDISYYSEEKFLAHIKQDHIKCHLCTHEDYKNVYYKNYKSLETHFMMSHYMCIVPECKAKCFIVFKTRGEQEKHNVNIHGANAADLKAMLFTVEKVDEAIKDHEGEDMTPMLLSQWKKVLNKEESQDSTIAYDKRIMLVDLFEHYVSVATLSVDEERNIVHTYNTAGKGQKGAKEADVHFEDVKFSKVEKKQNINFADFITKARQILDAKSESELVMYVETYNKYATNPKELFDKFCLVFGPTLAYKYFQYFSKTVKQPQKTYELDEFLDRKLQLLPAKNKNMLFAIKTWRDFFSKIISEISKNIISRLAKSNASDKSSKVSQGRLVQLLGCIKALTIKEFIKFKYLANFLKDQESKKNLQRALVVPDNRTTQMLDRIGTEDLLVMFLYFNLASSKFEGKIITTNTKLNPNTTKLFLRHYPDVAKQYSISIASEEEDYEEVEGKNAERQTEDEAKVRHSTKKPNANVVLGAKKDVLVNNIENAVNLNLDDKYDFPSLAPPLPKEDKSAKELKTRGFNMGWGANATVIYENEATKKKALNEEFPSLEADSQEKSNILDKMRIKKEDPLEKRFNYKQSSKPDVSEPKPGERNIMAELNKASSGVIVVKKKKKKK